MTKSETLELIKIVEDLGKFLDEYIHKTEKRFLWLEKALAEHIYPPKVKL